MKKILVTGATGFIGRNVVDYLLENDYEIHSIVYPDFVEKKANVVQHKINLMDTKEVSELLSEYKFENLIHLAWYVGAGCQTSEVNLDWMNVSLNLLKKFKNNGGKRVLFTGSMSEYDFRYGYMSEDLTPLNNEFLYGKTKAALYKLFKDYCERENLDYKWARLFNIYGPNEREARLVPAVIISMLKGEDVKVSTCTKFQDYLYVKDIALAIVKLFESKTKDAVNISSGQPVQLKYIVNKIAQLTNFKGKILWGAIPTYFEQELVVGNNSRLKNEVGFTPEYTLEDGLAETIVWWKEKINV